jgi:hypothetical protein
MLYSSLIHSNRVHAPGSPVLPGESRPSTTPDSSRPRFRDLCVELGEPPGGAALPARGPAATRLGACIVAGTVGLFVPFGPAGAAVGECSPCVGLHVTDPAAAFAALDGAPQLPEGSLLYLAWSVDLGADESVAAAREALARSGTRPTGGRLLPFVEVGFRTPAPLLQNASALEVELRRLAELAATAPPGSSFQLRWPAEGSALAQPEELSFLVKRAAAVVGGAQPAARVIGPSVGPDAPALRALFADDLAAYLDGVAASSLGDAAGTHPLLDELDPGSELVLQGVPLPDPPTRALVEAARAAEAGVTLTLFTLPASASPTAEQLQPLVLLARELRGDVSFDPYSTPSVAPAVAGRAAWSFVRGEDLGLRVIVDAGTSPAAARRVVVELADPLLTAPELFDPATGDASPVFGGQRTRGGYRLEVEDPPPAFLLAFERAAAASVTGISSVEERVLVEDERSMPVSEILRRLQAFEDAQARRLRSYTSTYSTSLRFQLAGGVQSLDITFRGAFFFRQGEGFDWAWDEFLVNGVRWRSKRIPEIPLIQPEKATAMPLEITFTKEYVYRLRGTETVNGRDCWVVDFEPAVAVEAGRSLYQGTVFVDRELYTRVRTRAVQLGLEGDVMSNEEIFTYSPLDGAGQPTAWTADAYYLPLHVGGQRLFSILNATTVVDREVTMSDVRINPADFEARREVKLASDVTMVRDTPVGMRYLVTDEETGERVVQEKLDNSRFFLVGGVFWDESQDYPLPLAGVNWLNFDFRGTGAQTNLFFAGPLLIGSLADPDLFGSRFDVGVDVFALAIPGTDSVFRDGSEVPEEDVETNRPNVDLSIGRPFGSFFKLDLNYSIGYSSFSRADDTAEEFVVPEDHLSHSLGMVARYNRGGWRLRAGATEHLRSDWEPWGLAVDGVVVNPDFAPDKDRYTLWEAGVAKIWHLPRFQKVGVELEYLGGENLDRFSKYEFGYFSDVRVHGYRSDRVRAEEAWATHLSYGFDIGSVFRVDAVGDVALATDELAGLEEELLAGAGIVGTFVGPWRTIVNLDVGVPVAGPDSGFSAFIAFLKLFR